MIKINKDGGGQRWTAMKLVMDEMRAMSDNGDGRGWRWAVMDSNGNGDEIADGEG